MHKLDTGQARGLVFTFDKLLELRTNPIERCKEKADEAHSHVIPFK